MALSGLRIAIVIGMRENLNPLSLNEIICRQTLKVKDCVARATSEDVNETVIDGNLVAISADWLVGIYFGSTDGQQLPHLSREIQSDGKESFSILSSLDKSLIIAYL